MRKSFLAWTLAAALTVAPLGAPSAWAAAASSQLIAAQLPGGVTLARATVPQTAKALKAAVAERPDLAVSLTDTALAAKEKSKGRKLSSKEVMLIVDAAVSAAPEKASDIIQAALSAYPQYADELNALSLSQTRNNGPSGFDAPVDLYGGFGVGFGPGFPGSPGFSGSSPSGAIALPGGALTSVVNG